MYTLVTFGGAGGQHACQVADALGMGVIFIHPLAGVLSAYGMGLADIGALREETVEAPLTEEQVVLIFNFNFRIGFSYGWKNLQRGRKPTTLGSGSPVIKIPGV
jgi:hypothetical protein